jgi:hypothetical protein
LTINYSLLFLWAKFSLMAYYHHHLSI